MTYVAITLLVLLVVGILVVDFVCGLVDKARCDGYEGGYNDGYNDCLWMYPYEEADTAPEDDGPSDEELEEYEWKKII